ncbi:MAG: glycosyl hydrolase family 39 [Acidobacteria bacterium]|nr:MAG: glycosyl hydrolase family 39 [Acidobacteriota bacterium]
MEKSNFQTMLAMGSLLLALLCTYQQFLPGQSNLGARAENITIDTQAPSHPFPHYWEQMFGSGRASLSLRESYRHDLKAVKAVTEFRYVRFHGIFDRDVGVYNENKQGQAEYNFTYVDQIYDGLLASGIRPFVELSFMPQALASTSQQQEFFYHPYITPPKDWNRWGDLIGSFAQHLVARYGIDEVSQWYFEVWNEPNIGFWAGEPKQAKYFHLYDVAARSLKSVSVRIRVGGPATAQAAWVSAFVAHCAKEKVPVDFVSTHVYGDDTAENVFGTSQKITRRDMVAMAVKKVHDEVASSPMPYLPIIFSEYNATYMNIRDITDSAFMGPWLAETISRCDGLVHLLSYWAFSDVFEEQGVAKTPFYGGYGLVATGHISKAAYNDFALLHRLGTERLSEKPGPLIVTRRGDGTLAVALWNYAPPGHGGVARVYDLSFEGLRGAHHAIVWTVDQHHGSPLAAWEAMGGPQFPAPSQQQILRQAGQLFPPIIESMAADHPSLSITLEPHGLSLIEITQ